MQEKAKIYAIKTFKGKDKETQYYVMDCLLDNPQTSQNYKGLSSISVFIDKSVFDTIFPNFKPMQAVDLNVAITGNRVNYSIDI